MPHKCDVCSKEIEFSIDIWVQGFSHSKSDEFESKSCELEARECGGTDYISACFSCWETQLKTDWLQMIASLPGR